MKKLLFLLLLTATMMSCNQDEIIPEEVVLGEITSDEIDEVEMLRLVNEVRTNGYEIDNIFYNSVRKVEWDLKLFKATQIQCTYMFETGHYSHDWTDGTGLGKRLVWSDCYYRPAAENIAKGHRNIEEVLEGWLHSKPHREAIMDNRFNSIAVAKRGIYWTMVLGYKSPDGKY